MTFIKSLLKKKSVFPNAKHVIVPAFISKGIQYYKFQDIFQVPCMRALSAVQFHEEMKMRCTKEFLLLDLEAHQEVNKKLMECLDGGKGQISIKTAFELLAKSNKLLEQKKERLEWIVEPETLYNLASVIYFNEHENPYEYDSSYNRGKIAKWKEDKEALTFFLQTHIGTYLPSIEQSGIDSNQYLQVLEEMNEQQLAFITEQLSKSKVKFNSLQL